MEKEIEIYIKLYTHEFCEGTLTERIVWRRIVDLNLIPVGDIVWSNMMLARTEHQNEIEIFYYCLVGYEKGEICKVAFQSPEVESYWYIGVKRTEYNQFRFCLGDKSVYTFSETISVQS